MLKWSEVSMSQRFRNRVPAFWDWEETAEVVWESNTVSMSPGWCTGSCFGDIPLEGGLRADLAHCGRIKSLRWLWDIWEAPRASLGKRALVWHAWHTATLTHTGRNDIKTFAVLLGAHIYRIANEAKEKIGERISSARCSRKIQKVMKSKINDGVFL